MSPTKFCWYVDDIKLSHIDEKELTNMLAKIESKFGKMSVPGHMLYTAIRA